MLLLVYATTAVNAAVFWSQESPPGVAPGAVCLKTGCNMSGPIYMNGQIIYNATLVNGTFIGFVNASQVLNPYWLPLTGGNMTGTIDMNFNSILNIQTITANDWSNVSLSASQITNLNDTIQNQTGCSNPLVPCVNRENTFEADQFFKDGYRLHFRNISNNDTYFWYNASNQTLQLYVNGQLQQDWGASTTVYGVATFLGNINAQNVSGEGVFLNANLYVQKNVTTFEYYIGNGTYITDVCHTDGSGCENIPVNWSQINNTPGFIRYGDNIYLHAVGDTLYLNESKLNETIRDLDTDTHIVGSGPYLYDNYTFMYFNESKLNETINATFGLREEYVNITVSGGSGTGTTSECCYPSAEILQVAVFPTTSSNKYRFSANGTTSGEVVDADRKLHEGNWIVGHDGVVLYSETINLYLSNVLIDESFQVRIRWRP